MKTHTLRLRATDSAIFEAIKTGRKSIETRAATVKYKDIVAGDELVFVCGKERITKRIASVQKFASIDALFAAHRVQDIFPDLDTIEDARKVYGKFPGYLEKIRKSGLLAFKLEKG